MPRFLPPARQLATDAELLELPASWVALFQATSTPGQQQQQQQPPRRLRTAQASLLQWVASGRDFAGIAATGAGKSATWNLPAAAEAAAALCGSDPRALRPVHLVVIPLTAAGDPLEEESSAFLMQACSDAMPRTDDDTKQPQHRWPRALFVSRSTSSREHVRPAAPADSSRPVCLIGHPLVVPDVNAPRIYKEADCDSCGVFIAGRARRAFCRSTLSSARACDYDLCMACFGKLSGSKEAPATPSPAQLDAMPTSLPCGSCPVCTGLAKLATKYSHGCSWTCKVWKPKASGLWCKACQGRQNWKHCGKRADIVKAMQESSDGPATPEAQAGQSADLPTPPTVLAT